MKLQETYKKEVISKMMKESKYTNTMAVPRIRKVIIHTGFGKLAATKTGEEQRKTIQAIVEDLSVISGQRPVLTKSKKSISGFKLRKGIPIGAKATLRGARMYDFLNRFIGIVLPRSRDFHGLNPSGIDAKGNFTIGVPEHIFFPEILPEKVKNIFGFELTIVTNAGSKEKGLYLFTLLGFPITHS